MANKNLQNAVSTTCDFEEKTWTFEMEEGFIVSAGNFVIIPLDKFKELIKATKIALNTENLMPLQSVLTDLL